MLYLLTNSNYLCSRLVKTSMGIKFCTKRSSRYFKSILFLLLFVGSFISNNFYLHTHDIDGAIVYHSHPFTADAQHQHSSTSIELIQHINHTSFNFENSDLNLKYTVIFFSKLQFEHHIIHRLAKNKSKLFNRPPPVLA
jgi:hypothetical protein